jgi:hypothetical protein
MPEHFVVPPIGSRDGACIQRSDVGRCEDTLKALDFSNGLFGFHPVSIIQYEAEIGQIEAALVFPEPSCVA